MSELPTGWEDAALEAADLDMSNDETPRYFAKIIALRTANRLAALQAKRIAELESTWLSPEIYKTLMQERQETLHEFNARIAKLEPQADAYDFACEDMEKFQRERFEAGKEVGTQGSLCDGMAWVYGRLNELEAEVARLRKLLAPATGKRRKSTQTRSRPEAGARRS